MLVKEKEKESDINKFNLEMRESLRRSGKSIVNYAYLNKDFVIRLITANGELQRSDLDIFFTNLINEAEKLDM